MASKRPLALFSLPSSLRRSTCLQCQVRSLHKLNAVATRIPAPTPFVPDAPTFLTLIGRGMSAHAAKIPSWEALFSLSSQQLRESGVEPARARRYLLWWRERFRNGMFGIGGDLKEVKDGIAELRVVEVPAAKEYAKRLPATLTRDAGMRKLITNVTPTVALPPDPANPHDEKEKRAVSVMAALAPVKRLSEKEVNRVRGVKIVHGSIIGGTGVEPVKGHPGVARLAVKEGLWENRRGHKVDGGERRRAEVRWKRRAEERKNAR